MNMLRCQKCETQWLEAIRPDCPACALATGNIPPSAAAAIREMVATLKEKSVGTDDARALDAEAARRTDERLKLQLDAQARTQALHLRSVEASEREAAAWERIAAVLELAAKEQP